MKESDSLVNVLLLAEVVYVELLYGNDDDGNVTEEEDVEMALDFTVAGLVTVLVIGDSVDDDFVEDLVSGSLFEDLAIESLVEDLAGESLVEDLAEESLVEGPNNEASE